MEISGELTAISQDRVKPILFRVRNDIEQVVRISVDGEVEPPARAYTALPNVPGLIELLSVQRRTAEILRQESQLFVAEFLNMQGSVRVAPAEALRVEKLDQVALGFFVR